VALKDYFAILQLPPSATPEDIKKQYRILVRQYHPDYNQNNPDALLQFNLIKEAYEVLNHPLHRQQYFNDRWLAQSKGVVNYQTQVISPDILLKQILEIERSLAYTNQFNVDEKQIVKEIEAVCNEEAISNLKLLNEELVNKKIQQSIFKIANSLEVAGIEALNKIAYGLPNYNPTSFNELIKFKKQKAVWSKYQLLIVISIAVLVGFLVVKILLN
jgi:molecular chaperone DnaJ